MVNNFYKSSFTNHEKHARLLIVFHLSNVYLALIVSLGSCQGLGAGDRGQILPHSSLGGGGGGCRQ